MGSEMCIRDSIKRKWSSRENDLFLSLPGPIDVPMTVRTLQSLFGTLPPVPMRVASGSAHHSVWCEIVVGLGDCCSDDCRGDCHGKGTGVGTGVGGGNTSLNLSSSGVSSIGGVG